jgi:hypothetical protein
LNDLPLKITIGRGTARLGGGTLPKSTVSSVTIEIVPERCSPADFAVHLRKAIPPVIGYVSGNRFKLDVRTILRHQDSAVVETIRTACAEIA